MPQIVDITPSPRVLRMLGQIDFKPWQCLAELIDNSIDAFIDQKNDGVPHLNPYINILLPSENELREGSSCIQIHDNGVGMTIDQLQNAVKAGYSGNDPVEKMGLFGMGFNISTARLGRRTEVWTTTSDSSEWIGIVIDFDELEHKKTFSTPVLVREKTVHELRENIHGTQIKIYKLEPERIRPLLKTGKAITRKKLGKIYGRVMTSLGVQINYAGDVIKPWSHCIWNEERFVETSNFGYVYAVITIDKPLSPRKYCNVCWVWLNDDEVSCPSCGESENLVLRSRNLKGWIGIQRYFDKNHYGFDLIRNGRVIEELDKSMFYFETPQGEKELEYPIDAVHWGGRIVGELEIDFVRVSHQKDSFDKLDPEWKYVVEIIRGNSPLRPQIATRLGFSQNDSPLGKLFAGYRAGYAGLKCLVPGDEKGNGNNSSILSFTAKYENGDPDYQTDEKWYELVVLAENAKRGGSKQADEAGGALPILGTVSSDISKGEKPSAPSGQEQTENQGEKDTKLSKTYDLLVDHSKLQITVNAKIKRNESLANGYKVKASSFKLDFEYCPNHSLFEETLVDPADILIIDLSQHFLAISGKSPQELPVSLIARKIRENYFQETVTNLTSTSEAAKSFIDELRLFYDDNLPKKAPIEIGLFDPKTIEIIQSRIVSLGIPENIEILIRSGAFIQYSEPSLIIALVSYWPDLIFDGKFFNIQYDALNPEMKKEVIGSTINYLQNLLWLAGEGRDALSKNLAWKLKYEHSLTSMNILKYWRV
jgi:hypothetical protein